MIFIPHHPTKTGHLSRKKRFINLIFLGLTEEVMWAVWHPLVSAKEKKKLILKHVKPHHSSPLGRSLVEFGLSF